MSDPTNLTLSEAAWHLALFADRGSWEMHDGTPVDLQACAAAMVEGSATIEALRRNVTGQKNGRRSAMAMAVQQQKWREQAEAERDAALARAEQLDEALRSEMADSLAVKVERSKREAAEAERDDALARAERLAGENTRLIEQGQRDARSIAAAPHAAITDRPAANRNIATMQNPTSFRGYTIRYVTNDVAPDTLTACIDPPEGGNPIVTSQRIFRSIEAWHDDIRAKIERDIEVKHPSGKTIQQIQESERMLLRERDVEVRGSTGEAGDP